ncbi:MAG: aminoacyl-tRNA hydrolase [Mollicutes bacterium]|nr:aminoacyl-tRNA hydrolase [Mollicutes bacterium]
MKMVVGLGNPGKEYKKTRHNVGFIVLDNFLGNVKWKNQKEYLVYEKNINGEKTIFLKPQQYMNLSGLTVKKIADFYKIKNEDILVIHDDIDLKEGNYKLKINSTSGGHNGIKSIIKYLNGNDFLRLKIGVGNNKEMLTSDYVLGKLPKIEFENLNKDIYKNIIINFIEKGVADTINNFN